MTTYYAHSAQDELGNLLPYEHWQTLQSHSVNVGEMAAEFARVRKARDFRIHLARNERSKSSFGFPWIFSQLAISVFYHLSL